MSLLMASCSFSFYLLVGFDKREGSGRLAVGESGLGQDGRVREALEAEVVGLDSNDDR